TNWSIMRRNEIYPGWPRYVELRSGHEDGTHWLPAEVDVSIRPGWYYHPAEDHQVKSLPHLLDIYYNSVGRNASLLLNLPVDNRGLVHEKDVEQLLALKQQLDKDFKADLAKGLKVHATDYRGENAKYEAENVNDGNLQTYWATNNGVKQAAITIEFNNPTEVNRILLQEYIPLGQRIKNFIVSAEVNGEWQEIHGQTTIGYKRILRFDAVRATKIKVQIMDAKGPIAISNIELYRAPNLLIEPDIQRNRDGMVNFSIPDKNVEVHYTLDGSEPNTSSAKYEKPFLVNNPTTIKTMTFDPQSEEQTGVSSTYFDISKKDWEVVHTTTGSMFEASKLIDDDPKTFWATDDGVKTIQEVVIDLGKTLMLKGFTYWPMQERYPFGIITNFEFYVSQDDINWERVVRGEFANIVNSRVEQKVGFKTTKARYIKLRGIKVAGEDYRTSFAEIGVITE
ncbi:MAG: discoidin domain-containing protein, partial [Maribacter sp.]|nr:discoidin domain-containing protein [Maribacter sp.]